ncbi:unnamed protein product [Mytilus coruscus]|uniref:Uncharacterized protein n=1 Tax=Mytilus coruscus TaxID=42192 RepID=A0A6J8AL35_MYTCO|nr:unnamed protein product [Mytilus coruscus]
MLRTKCIIRILSVLIDVQKDRLVFGQTVELVCHLQGSLHLEDGSSRQWSGGAFNKVLSLNGYSSDINKYQEIIKTNTEFRLRVFNFNESDANQYYKCVYGFKYDETKLDLSKKLYEYIPHENEIDTRYIFNNKGETVTTEITIICSVGTRKIVTKTTKIPECDDRNELGTNYSPKIAMIVLTTMSIVLVCLVGLVLIYKWKHRSDYSRPRANKC